MHLIVLQHHLFHKRMTKNDAVPGYRLEKFTLKEETGGGRIQGTKEFLKGKKEGKVQQSKTERS